MHDGLRRLLALAAVFGIALLAVFLLRRDTPGHFGMFELVSGEPFPSAQSQSVLEFLNDEFANLTRTAIPSVVSIDTTTTIRVPHIVTGHFADSTARAGRYTQPGLGSGVIVSKEGHVITNYHVIAGVDEIQITTSDRRTYLATVTGTDERSDIAVLLIEAEDTEFTPLPFADSDAAQVGHIVMAIGNPFGLSETVTRGIISAKQRFISDAAPSVFQTDTVINPGNSGGPLINVRGEIVGINVALYAGQKDVRVWQGVGLAIPSNEVKEAFQAIIQNRNHSHGFLGVRVQELVRAKPVDDYFEAGVLIDAVEPGSPAEKAGLLPGDVLLDFDGESISSTTALMRRIKYSAVGSSVTFTVMRNDVSFELTATIGDRPASGAPSSTDPVRTSSGPATDVQTGTGSFEENLGIHVRSLTGYERRRIGMAPSDPGILIAEINPGSPVGGVLRTHDIITHANIYPIHTPEQLADAFKVLPLDERAILEYIRDGQSHTIPFVPRETK